MFKKLALSLFTIVFLGSLAGFATLNFNNSITKSAEAAATTKKSFIDSTTSITWCDQEPTVRECKCRNAAGQQISCSDKIKSKNSTSKVVTKKTTSNSFVAKNNGETRVVWCSKYDLPPDCTPKKKSTSNKKTTSTKDTSYTCKPACVFGETCTKFGCTEKVTITKSNKTAAVSPF